jgi:hypothetical protein
LNLRGFAFELMHVAGRRAIDGDPPRLHSLGDFPLLRLIFPTAPVLVMTRFVLAAFLIAAFLLTAFLLANFVTFIASSLSGTLRLANAGGAHLGEGDFLRSPKHAP